MSHSLRRSLFTVACMASVASAVDASAAMADGGQSIASATPVVFSQQLFGNTATGADEAGESNNNCGGYYQFKAKRSFWTLPVISGDKVTIDWQVANKFTCLQLYPVGTTDFTIDSVESPTTGKAVVLPVLNENPAGNLKTESTYVATRSGAMSLIFRSMNETQLNAPFVDQTGPYDFTATVKHAVRLALPRSIALRRTGTINVSVHDPAGGPIAGNGLTVDLQARVGSISRKIGTAKASGTSAHIKYRIPAVFRGRKVVLRALAHGPDYINATSNTVRARAR